MGVRGLGGIFFKSDDPERLSQWYEEHLGVHRDADGYTVFGWRQLDQPTKFGGTVWSPFASDTDYFSPSSSEWMLNFRVDNLDAELKALEERGVETVGEPEEFEYGRFGWVLDCDGNKIELWEPPESAAFVPTVPADAARFIDRPGVWVCEPGSEIAAGATGMADRAIVLYAELPLTPEEVWRLWTTNEGLAEWLVDHSRIELSIGGAYELYFNMDEEPGRRGGEGCKVLSYLEPRMLSFTWNAPPHLEYTRSRLTHVVIEFDAIEGGGTRVQLTHTGWPTADADDHSQWDETFSYFQNAWARVFELLESRARCE